MLVVKDAMILIHLANLTLLDSTCAYFGGVAIPTKVKTEAVDTGQERGYPDAAVIADVIEQSGIDVYDVEDTALIEQANRYNIQGGEAKAVALYWERDADLLATDDDNVRRKRSLLDLELVGTPAILLELFDIGAVGSRKLRSAIDELREIGWFSTAVLDKLELEAGLA